MKFLKIFITVLFVLVLSGCSGGKQNNIVIDEKLCPAGVDIVGLTTSERVKNIDVDPDCEDE
jgi:hypothetical protein